MRRLIGVCLGLLLLPAAATAAVELTLATGLRWGDAGYPSEATSALIICVTTPCAVVDASTEEGGPHLSLIADVPLSGPWMVEGLLTRWDGDMEFRSQFTGLAERGTFDSTTIQVGLLRQWEGVRWRPFAAAALGVTSFESSVPAYDRPFFPGILTQPVDEEVASASVAGGAKADLGRNFALRLEGRIFWHDFSDRVGGALVQPQATVGLTYGW